MANVKISELPVAATLGQTSIIPIVVSGITKRTTKDTLSPQSVLDYGAIPDGSTSNTTAFATAIAAVPTGGVLRFPPTSAGSTYMGVISVRRSDITLQFEGVTIKQPSGTSSPAVIELGDLASGNSATAYSNIYITGQVTIDGNRTGITAPTSDLTGQGIALTKITGYRISGVRAINCYNAGVGIFINSNEGQVDCIVENCGNLTYTQPGFDINGSKYITGSVVSYGCYDGARVLDNCWGIDLRVSVYNATRHGFVYNNQSVNASYNNNFDVAVYTCGTHGFIVGLNCTNSNIRAAIYNATNVGMTFTNDPTYHSTNLNIDLCTKSCGDQGILLYGDDCTVRHQSYLDGRSGAQGAVFAVDVYGNRNKLTVDLIDSSTWQVRGIAFRSGATDNEIISYTYTNTASPLSDSGTRTKIHAAGTGATVTASSTIDLPIAGLVIPITGATSIDTINAVRKGVYVLTFDSTLTVTDGNNLKLAGNFSATADDTLTGYHNGTNFYEIARSNN